MSVLVNIEGHFMQQKYHNGPDVSRNFVSFRVLQHHIVFLCLLEHFYTTLTLVTGCLWLGFGTIAIQHKLLYNCCKPG